MRSLYWRIAAGFATAFIFLLLSTLWMSGRFWGHALRGFFDRSTSFEMLQSQKAYEKGGVPELKSCLDELNEELKGTRYLTDANGRDLITGVDRSSMMNIGKNWWGAPKKINGRIVISKPSPDRKYVLIIISSPPFEFWNNFWPYFLIVTLVIAGIAWDLSVGIVSPLLKVSHTVEQFGRGDLSVRIGSRRKDEIGTVARSFDNMAERIEMLLTAERRLLQDVSHELRSPLARLSFAAELMKTAPDQEAAAARLRREVDRLTRLVSTLVEVTSAEGDPESRRRVPIALPDLIREIVGDCAIEAKVRNVEIITGSFAEAHIEGDPELIRRAIENVVRNAIRYAPAKTSVSVNVEVLDGNVEIRVRDCGCGVPEDKLAKIFDPFYRVDDSRDASNGGMGLGLSIARRAIHLHLGRIYAHNASPGLEVTLTIPASRSIIS